MLKKPCINLSFKDRIEGGITPTVDRAPNSLPEPKLNMDTFGSQELEHSSENSGGVRTKNCWSGYHVRFRNPRNFQEFAIDKEFNRWGDMVEFFSQQERPYKLSQGSLKDLLYGTYKRKGMHSLSLNDLVSIEKIGRTRITKSKTTESADSIEQTDEQTTLPGTQVLVQM